MDLTHELGHVLWGSFAGGHLAYLQITYFQIYPNFALTPIFVLGCVEVMGLTTGFAEGLLLLGGSVTTNIVAWLLGLFLLRVHTGNRKQAILKTLGFFGILDLPLYVLLPQIGLQHWILLGGNTPEPLLGARQVGIPDPAFYAIVVLATLGLLLLYLPRFRTFLFKQLKRWRTQDNKNNLSPTSSLSSKTMGYLFFYFFPTQGSIPRKPRKFSSIASRPQNKAENPH